MDTLDKLVPIEAAQQAILDKVSALDAETIPLEEALGRVLAEDVHSDIDVAPFDNSAMDGFALRASDLAGATKDTPAQLEIIACVAAGDWLEQEVQPGQCVRIMTGAALPTGVDSVEKIEAVQFTGEGLTGDILLLDHTLEQGKHVRYRGEERKAGDVVLRAGVVIDPAAMGLLASTGNVAIPVRKKPVVGILSLGSELVAADETPGPGKIRNSNAYALSGCAARAGAIFKTYPVLPDDYDAIKKALALAARECDFVVSSGGAASGDFDFITQIASELGEVFYKYVNMRPGKAQTFALVDGTPFLGLAGNPAAAVCGFEMLVFPALQKMQGRTRLFHPVQRATLAVDAKKYDTRWNFQRATLQRSEDGTLLASPYDNQSSALYGIFQQSDCLIVVPGNSGPISAGEEVDCVRFDIAPDAVL